MQTSLRGPSLNNYNFTTWVNDGSRSLSDRLLFCLCLHVSHVRLERMGNSLPQKNQDTPRVITTTTTTTKEVRTTLIFASYLFDQNCYISSQWFPMDCFRLILLNMASLPDTKYKCFHCAQTFCDNQELTKLSNSRIRIARLQNIVPDIADVECRSCNTSK